MQELPFALRRLTCRPYKGEKVPLVKWVIVGALLDLCAALDMILPPHTGPH